MLPVELNSLKSPRESGSTRSQSESGDITWLEAIGGLHTVQYATTESRLIPPQLNELHSLLSHHEEFGLFSAALHIETSKECHACDCCGVSRKFKPVDIGEVPARLNVEHLICVTRRLHGAEKSVDFNSKPGSK